MVSMWRLFSRRAGERYCGRVVLEHWIDGDYYR